MLTVACVLSEGPVYNESHVDRLRGLVSRYLAQPYQFVCVTDSPLPGWWAKIDLFKPGRFSDRVLYLDLDVTVTGGLDDLADYPAPFVIIKNWPEIREPVKARFNSSVMSWDAGVADHLFTEFEPSVMERLNGDQDWISEQRPQASVFPRDWCVSYKVQRYRKLKTLPADARVVVYHGKPKSWDLPKNHLEQFRVIQRC